MYREYICQDCKEPVTVWQVHGKTKRRCPDCQEQFVVESAQRRYKAKGVKPMNRIDDPNDRHYQRRRQKLVDTAQRLGLSYQWVTP